MNKENRKRTLIVSFIFGMLGCICFGSGDWLMIYGNPNKTRGAYGKRAILR